MKNVHTLLIPDIHGRIFWKEAIEYYSKALSIDSYYVYCDWKKAICFVKMRRRKTSEPFLLDLPFS